jgi:hypothetical protein
MEVVETVIVPLLVFPLKQVAGVVVLAHAFPLAVARAPESSPVLPPPPLGVYFPIWTDEVPVTVGAVALPVSVCVPPITNTSTIVDAAGIVQCPLNCAAVNAVED